MKTLNQDQLRSVSGGAVDPNSTEYKVGEVVGTVIKDVGEVAGFIGAAVVAAGAALSGAGS